MNIICIRIRSFSEDRILFVFGHFRKTEYYSYSYSVIFRRPNIIRIRIRSFSEGRILFVFVFGHFWKTEYYSYSYSVIFGRPNNIRIRIRTSKHYSLTSVPEEELDNNLKKKSGINSLEYFGTNIQLNVEWSICQVCQEYQVVFLSDPGIPGPICQ